MIKWTKHLISDIARRRCVIFLGAGVSRNSTNKDGRRPATWEGFLKSLLDQVTPNQHIRTALNQQDYLTACELLKREIGKEEFNLALKDEYLEPQYTAARIHELIFKLDSRIVATPNFEKIYETYANNEAGGSIVLKHHYDPDVATYIRDQGRIILKIHGTIDSPDRMIFTRKEYAEARSKHSSFYSLLDALALTSTFLFFGCGVNDPDIKLLLEDSFFRHQSQRCHYMTLPSKEVHKKVISIIEDTMNLKIVNYSPSNGHKELTDSIEDLVTKVEAERVNLKLYNNW